MSLGLSHHLFVLLHAHLLALIVDLGIVDNRDVDWDCRDLGDWIVEQGLGLGRGVDDLLIRKESVEPLHRQNRSIVDRS